jgi:O-antigen/teichoic acid export membrane protein
VNEYSAAGASGPGDLRRSVARGVKWTSASAGAIFMLGLGQIAVLAHLLQPRDFGLVAATTVLLGIAQAFGDMGLSAAIIVRQTTSRETLSSLYWANVLAGVVVSALAVASTPLIVAFFHEHRLHHLVPWAAAVFAVKGVGQQFQVLLERELRFSTLARFEVAAAAAGAATAISAAVAGAGAVSLIWGMLAQAAMMAALLCAVGWREWPPLLRLRRAELRDYLGFGAYQMGERIVNYLTANVDYILIGRYLGVMALGTYSIAYQVVVKPLVQFNPIVTRVAFPAFARKQADDAALRRGYGEVIRLIGFVVVPMLTGLALVAPFFVPVAFGSRWHRSIVLIEILSVLGALKALSNPVGSVLLAKNRPDVGFKVNAGYLAVMAAALWGAVHVGLVTVAIVETAVVLGVVVVWLRILERVIGFSIREWLGRIWPAARSAALMGMAVFVVRLELPGQISGDSARLAIAVAVGTVVYVLCVLLFDRPYARSILALLRSRKGLLPAAAPAAAEVVPPPAEEVEIPEPEPTLDALPDHEGEGAPEVPVPRQGPLEQ